MPDRLSGVRQAEGQISTFKKADLRQDGIRPYFHGFSWSVEKMDSEQERTGPVGWLGPGHVSKQYQGLLYPVQMDPELQCGVDRHGAFNA